MQLGRRGSNTRAPVRVRSQALFQATPLRCGNSSAKCKGRSRSCAAPAAQPLCAATGYAYLSGLVMIIQPDCLIIRPILGALPGPSVTVSQVGGAYRFTEMRRLGDEYR